MNIRKCNYTYIIFVFNFKFVFYLFLQRQEYNNAKYILKFLFS